MSAHGRMLACAVALTFLRVASAQEQRTQSELEHVPPDAPVGHVHDMPYSEMAQMMGMDDRSPLGKVTLDRLEWLDSDADSLAWDVSAWYGNDFDKLWLKTEGGRTGGVTEHAGVELLWDHIVSRWWNLQTGVRQDLGPDSRTWAAVGVQGLAPGFIEVQATAYVGEGGRTAARFVAEYDLLFTQRLVLQPALQLNLYGKDDEQRGIGAGLSDLELGLRLRYEFRREFAPYVGALWARRFGDTADPARAAGEDSDEIQFVAGVRLWF